MLFNKDEIKKIVVCTSLAETLNELTEFFERFVVNINGISALNLTTIIFKQLKSLIIKFDNFLVENKYISLESVNDFDFNLRAILYTKGKDELSGFLGSFTQSIISFLSRFEEVSEYKNDFNDDVNNILKNCDKLISVINNLDNSNYRINKFYIENNNKPNTLSIPYAKGQSIDASESSGTRISELRKKFGDSVLSKNKDENGNENKEFNFYESDIYVNFKNKSEVILKDFNDEINRSKANFKKDVEDEVAKFKVNFSKVDTDFKNSVKDFEILKKFINAKGEKEITDHYKNKAKWERVTYWVMTFVTFGIIILSVCMALKGLDEYKVKANISVETLLEKYKDQPVEKIEKIYGAVQSSALTYLVLRLIFSVLLFSSIIYTSRVAYRAYIHMRHSENMMLKLATLRPFINQLDESERNQIHKDLVPDYFGKDAGLVDGASEKFKDLPANVSAVAMKAIEQIGGSPSTNNSKAPDPKDAKPAGE